MKMTNQKQKILITSALPYVNNVPHLGNLIGCVLSADVYARFQRLYGNDVLFVCGTDDYGTASEIKARESKVTCPKLCQKYHDEHKKIYDWFNINFDVFGKTSTPNPKANIKWTHTQICHSIFQDLVSNDYVMEKEIEQLYCTEIESFVADRYIKGQCPKCLEQDIDGSQCNKCDQLYPATELINPYYKFNEKYKLQIRKTNHLFLRLPKFKSQLTDIWLHQGKWTQVANNITLSWLSNELLDRCITRDLKWGTPVPDTEKFGSKYQDKVFYVWFDAPIGYISITANEYPSTWKEWWMNPSVKLVQFMAKDNVPFHSVIFPSILKGSGKPYNIVNDLSAIDYLNYEGGRFSKRNGIGVFGDNAIDSGISSDIWRFYLLKIRPETNDSTFDWLDFEQKINSELVNNFSNLVHRVLSLTFKNFGKIPEIVDFKPFNKLNRKYLSILLEYTQAFQNLELRRAQNKFLEFSGKCNLFLDDHEPWKQLKENPKHAENSLAIMCHFIICLSVMIQPFIPECSEKIQSYLNLSHQKFILEPNSFFNHVIRKPKIIFKRLSIKDNNRLSAFIKKCSS